MAANAMRPLTDSATDALFRTGPGPFTDVVLRYAMGGQGNQTAALKVRLMPRVVLGGLPGGRDYVKVWEEPSR